MDYNFVQQDKLFSKKNIITYLILVIVIVAVPLGVRLVQTQTQLKSKAATGNEIKFVESNTLKCDATSCTTTTSEVEVEIKAPDF